MAALVVLTAILLVSYVHAGPWSQWESKGKVNEDRGDTALGSMRAEVEDEYAIEAILVPNEDGGVSCGYRYYYLADITDEGHHNYKSMTNIPTIVTSFPLMRSALKDCRARIEREVDLPAANIQPRHEP